jgi:TonB-dependent Receptor Plug Domain.
VADALPAPPPAIVVTGAALPEAKAETVYATARINARQIEQSPSHELDQLWKTVRGVKLSRRSDARSGHPTSQGVTLRALGGNASSRALLVLDGVPQADPFGGWAIGQRMIRRASPASVWCAVAAVSATVRERAPARSK